MTTSINNNINYTFKMLYIIAIFMVIDGHIGTFDYLTLQGLMPYQNFHLSLFMFASGYFFKLNLTFKDFFIKKTSNLILPLYGWNIFYGLLCLILNTHFNYSLGDNFNLYNIFIAPLTDGHQFIYNMASWFIVPLFVLQIITYIILKPLTIKTPLSALKIITFFLIIFTFSSIITPFAPSRLGERDFSLLFYRTIYFYPSFAFGILYHHVLEKYDTLPTPLHLFITLITYITLTTFFPYYNHIPSWLNFLNEPAYILFLISFTAIIFWLRISRCLSYLVQQSKTLSLISNHTFAIMLHHFIGFVILKNIFSFFFHDINLHEVRTNIWYNYFPFSENISTPIILTITLAITFLIDFVKDALFKTIKRHINTLNKKENIISNT